MGNLKQRGRVWFLVRSYAGLGDGEVCGVSGKSHYTEIMSPYIDTFPPGHQNKLNRYDTRYLRGKKVLLLKNNMMLILRKQGTWVEIRFTLVFWAIRGCNWN